GDRGAPARAVAAALGITEVHTELLPAQKAEFIERWRQVWVLRPDAPAEGTQQAEATEGWRQRPRRVAMVGDGINDAPALAGADVGLAIGGTDVAAEAGDVVFMGDPLKPLPLLVQLSRETVRIIRQNILIFAIGVNVVGIVLTAWLWPVFAPAKWEKHGPLAAVIYHQVGSLAVLLNSMRLLVFGRAAGWRVVRGTGKALRRIDQWIDRLDPGEFFHWLGHHWRPVALGGAALVLIVYALTGLTRVGPDEVAVVR